VESEFSRQEIFEEGLIVEVAKRFTASALVFNPQKEMRAQAYRCRARTAFFILSLL